MRVLAGFLAALAMDWCMDFCVLAITQLVCGQLRLRRLFAAFGAMLTFSLAALLLGRPTFLWQIAASVACAAILTGERRPLRILEAALCILCSFAVAAGLAGLGGGRRLLLAPTGALLVLLLMRRRRNPRFRWNIELRVSSDGSCDVFPALIDTGNRLREGRSDLPVLIVEAAAAPRLAAHMQHLPDAQKRALPFGVLGGGGQLLCFRPDKIEILSPGLRGYGAPDCYVALFDGRIPGGTCALAPPEFADAAQERAIMIEFIFHLRRFINGVFKRKAIHLRNGRSIPTGRRLLHRRKRPAPAAAEPRGGACPRAQSQRRGQVGALYDDRAQSQARGLHRPQI